MDVIKEVISEQDSGEVYSQLCQLAQTNPFNESIDLNSYAIIDNFAHKAKDERMAAALQVLLELSLEPEANIEKVDKHLLDFYIAKIDAMLSEQLDQILHHPEFQRVESLWRSLAYLVDKTDFRANIKYEILDISKDELIDDFEDIVDTTQSVLYKHVYEQEFDTPGGEPFTAMVSPYEFDASHVDIFLLRNLAKVAASAHCPFLGNVDAEFFGKKDFSEVIKIEELEDYMERAEFIRWNSFRESEDARYIGLSLPRFLLRLPYGQGQRVRSFNYEENVINGGKGFLWGSASFAFACNMARSFKQYGWCVNIRGPLSGGKVENLPLHQYDVGRGLQTKMPTECLISETQELALSELGFIPLSYYKNSDYACFFSASSTQKAPLYDDSTATANSKINARLPYIFLSARLAHYLKVLQRENIGANKTRSELETELNRWLGTLITKMNNPGPELSASHPLRDGLVMVETIPENPGLYRVSLHATPHFQVEGMEVRLSLVAQLPTSDK